MRCGEKHTRVTGKFVLTGSAITFCTPDRRLSSSSSRQPTTDRCLRSHPRHAGIRGAPPQRPSIRRRGFPAFTFRPIPAHRLGAAGKRSIRALSLTPLLWANRSAAPMNLRHHNRLPQDPQSVRAAHRRFRALKHMAADLLLEVESATSAAHRTAAQFRHRPRGPGRAVALARLNACRAYHATAMAAIQMQRRRLSRGVLCSPVPDEPRTGRQLFGSSRGSPRALPWPRRAPE